MKLIKLTLVLFLSIYVSFSLISCLKDETIQIGAMLSLSGNYFTQWKEPLEWAVENINENGGISGKKIAIVYRDTSVAALSEIADSFINDERIKAVIGPITSREVFDVAPSFIKAKKVMISPSATSDEIFRAFSGKKYIWRTVESDIAQLKTLLIIAREKEIQNISLITSTDKYGTTFFNWFGFFALELGMTVSNIIQFDQVSTIACESYVDTAVSDSPDAIIVVPSTTEAAVCIAKRIKEQSSDIKILFSDGGQLDALIDELGDDVEGIEGTSISPDPQGGFETSYNNKFNEQPPPFAANIYDAVLLLGYGLIRSSGEGGEALADAIIEITDARGEDIGWDKEEIKKGIALIEQGNLPNISGASGNLDFDYEFHMDVISSTYGLWRIENGEFVALNFYASSEDTDSSVQSSMSIYRTYASEARKQDIDEGITSNYAPKEKEGLWALVMAGSSGWENYRHQADALAQYQLLKANGLDDDRIIFIIEDDIAYNSSNKEQGVVRNVAEGENLYHDLEIDYHPSALTITDVKSIIIGASSDSLPKVIESTEKDNVYIFLVGHGNRDGYILGNLSAASVLNIFSPDDLSEVISDMYNQNKYRFVFTAIESCHSGNLGTKLDLPGAILISSASPTEVSFGANFDSTLNAWLADGFAYSFVTMLTNTPTLTINDFYEDIYLDISGSHISVYNFQNFGDVNEISLEEFIKP